MNDDLSVRSNSADDTELTGNRLAGIEHWKSPKIAAASGLLEVNHDPFGTDSLTFSALDQKSIDAIVEEVPGGAANVQDIYPLSPSQEGMLFHHLMNDQADTYVMVTLFELKSRSHADVLVEALQRLIDRHDVLRSAMSWEKLPRPVQVVYRRACLPVEEIQLDPARGEHEQIKELMRPETQRMNLRLAPLLGLLVVRGSGEQCYALLKRHHLIFDQSTWNSVVEEATAYILGRGHELPVPLRYRNYVAWALENRREEDAELFFRGKLGEVEEPTAPFGLLDVHGEGSRLAEAFQLVEPALARRIRIEARRLGTSAARLFHAAWGLVVAKTSGREEAVFGTVLSAERSRGKQRPLGLMVNTLPLRLQLHNVTAQQFVTQTHQELEALLGFAQAPLTLAQRCAGYVGAAPLFTAVLNYRYTAHNSVVSRKVEWGEDSGIRVIANQYRTNYPISVAVDNRGEEFALTAQTESPVDPLKIITYLVTAMQSLLDALERSPQTPAMLLSIVPGNERHELIELLNDPHGAAVQPRLVDQLFEEQVVLTPDAIAVIHGEEQLTYEQLNRKANQLARHLRARGVGPDRVVGLCVGRSIEMVVGVLGILKAGGAYMPMDPSHPPERLEHMLREAKPRVLLTQQTLKEGLPETAAEVIALDSDWEQIDGQCADNLDWPCAERNLRHLAYVIYTSGSTGMPKGVMVDHAGLSNYVLWARRVYVPQHGSAIPVSSPLVFDATATSLYCALLTGRSAVLLTEGEELEELEQLLQKNGSWSLIKVSPAHLQALGPRLRTVKPPLTVNAIVVGGEALPPSTVELWRSFWPEVRLINQYGPTETVVACSMFDVPRDWASGSCVPIGRPASNVQLFVLDSRLQPVPIGVPGELYVGGGQLSRGYLNRAGLTAERFVANPFKPCGSRMYRTGDQVRHLPDGNLEFLGRIDHQVKIRGYRIELGELESVLLRHAAVKQAVVLAREDVPGDKRLVAYIVGDRSVQAEAASDLELEALRKEGVSEWAVVHEQTYEENSIRGPSFVGWNSSYSGEPLPEVEMKEWLDRTVERIRGLHPKRTIEIGCGVGLLLQHLAPHCSIYVGADFSNSAIRQLQQWMNGREALNHVELLHRSATELGDLRQASFDTVILNSVVQYFPDIDYLLTVLEQAVRLVAPGGRIFLGDVRHLGSLAMFHSAVQLSKAAATVSVGQLRRRIAQALAQEKELVIDPQFFHALPGRLAGIKSATVQLKRGRAWNELTRHRYDVVLQIGDGIDGQVACEPSQDDITIESTAELESALSDGRWRVLQIRALKNARLAQEAAAYRLIERSDERLETGVLRRQLSELPVEGFDPEAVWELGRARGYDVQLSPNATDTFDVLVRRQAQHVQLGRVTPSASHGLRPWNEYANDPLENGFRLQLIPQLREYLQGRLPEYMIPAAWMVLKQLPLTLNGKVDRRALPNPQSRAEEMGEYIAPRTDLERTLADMWAELLQVDRVGVHDNFFELGGHSLLIVQMREQLRRIGLSVKVRSIYASPTIAELARVLVPETANAFTPPPNLIPEGCVAITPEMLTLVSLDAAQLERVTQAVPGGSANVQDIYPLTAMQEGMLFHHLVNDQIGDAYARWILLSSSSREKLDEVIKALQQVIDRHDILRTAILWEQLPQPLQVVHRRAVLPVEQIELDQGRDPIAQLKERMKAKGHRLDLRRAPLLRLHIATDAGGHCHALLQTHHLVFDAESMHAMLAEVKAHLHGRMKTLPLPVAYRNHVAQALAQSQDDEAFFRGKLASIDEPTAPYGVLDVHTDGSSTRIAEHSLQPELVRKIRLQARRCGVSAATLFHAAWGLVVARASGRDDVVFGTVLLGRLQGNAGGQRILGMFINTLPLRLQLLGLTARELVDRTQRELVELMNHEQSSLALAQRCSGVAGSVPLFTALLSYRHSSLDQHAELDDGVSVRFPGSQGGTNYPITLSVADKDEEFVLEMQTDPGINPDRMLDNTSIALQSLVDALERTPHTLALALPILSTSEQRQLVKQFNATQSSYPHDQLIHQVFEQQVKLTPDAVAVTYADHALTYAELNRKANQLARYLGSRGLEPGDFVPVVMSRSLQMLVAQIAVLKTAGVYVPVDPALPADRQTFIFRDCGARYVLVAGDQLPDLDTGSAQQIDCSAAGDAIEGYATDDLDVRLQARPAAYVMYTSGSTGVPKGVVVAHHSVNRLAINNGYASIGPGDCIAHYSNPAFDASTFEIWGALLNGAVVSIVPQSCVLDVTLFAAVLKQHRVTLLYMSVGLFNQFADAMAQALSNLRYLLVGGDSLDPSVIKRVLLNSPPRQLLNVYGPTECTTFSTAYRIEAVAEQATSIPIGSPISNAQIHILDARGQLVPLGVAGEIYIGGAGVACGYLNRPELTAERFIPDPFGTDPRDRLYRTGDIGRWRSDGAIEFLGRNDSQVKIRGFRIELGEIEVHLSRHPNLKEVVVLARADAPGEKRIVAYVVPADPLQTPSAQELSTWLKRTLPEYMVPTAFVILDRMPLTGTGKVNRQMLPQPKLDVSLSNGYEAPQGEAEELLAGIWRDLLRLDQVGRDDSFFDLGGHSLLAIKVLFKINQSFSSVLRVTDIYANPTIRELAARIRNGWMDEEFVDLAQEAALDNSVVANPGRIAVPAATILLTGATGFVGRFLLAQLLQDTDAVVYCLVRATTQAQASLRLKESLARWGLWWDHLESRIVAVAGDLRLPHLGLDASNYRTLAERVDSIYHCGTSMNHLETYAMARAANVESARELLKFATQSKPKTINYLSTLGVFSASPGASRLVNEQTGIDDEKHWASRGYAASKWVGEKIFMTANERGIPCNIFRLGLVWADSRQGRFDELQREYRILKSCFLSGYGIQKYRYRLAPTPVDYAARAIVHLASRHGDGGGLFHIASPRHEIDGLFERCNELADAALELLPLYEWTRQIRRLHHGGMALPVVPLIEFAFSMDEETFHEYQRRNLRFTNMQVDCSSTHRELERDGVVAPVLNDDLLNVCLTGMFSRDVELRTLLERSEDGPLSAKKSA